VESDADLIGLRRAGAVVRAGITTRDLDAIAGGVIARAGARSAPKLVYAFPGETCISVNDEIVHGVPGARVVAAGDLVKLDVTVELDGYMADACESVAVPPVATASERLIDCAREAFHAGLAQVRPGVRAYDIGEAVHTTVRQRGFTVVRALMGHGIGRTIHEAPSIPNYREPRCADVLTEGMVFTIEPLIAAGTGRMVTLRDGWTLRTRDRARSAHHEHTVMVTATGAQLLTA
jgi:methionyl aminopeptidase